MGEFLGDVILYLTLWVGITALIYYFKYGCTNIFNAESEADPGVRPGSVQTDCLTTKCDNVLFDNIRDSDNRNTSNSSELPAEPNRSFKNLDQPAPSAPPLEFSSTSSLQTELEDLPPTYEEMLRNTNMK